MHNVVLHEVTTTTDTNISILRTIYFHSPTVMYEWA